MTSEQKSVQHKLVPRVFVLREQWNMKKSILSIFYWICLNGCRLIALIIIFSRFNCLIYLSLTFGLCYWKQNDLNDVVESRKGIIYWWNDKWGLELTASGFFFHFYDLIAMLCWFKESKHHSVQAIKLIK